MCERRHYKFLAKWVGELPRQYKRKYGTPPHTAGSAPVYTEHDVYILLAEALQQENTNFKRDVFYKAVETQRSTL